MTEWQDRSTCVLSGDGAGPIVLSPTENEAEKSIIRVLVQPMESIPNSEYCQQEAQENQRM
jgi:3-oxoacyl-[acyl-carrier-protein] synthase III